MFSISRFCDISVSDYVHENGNASVKLGYVSMLPCIHFFVGLRDGWRNGSWPTNQRTSALGRCHPEDDCFLSGERAIGAKVREGAERVNFPESPVH